MSNYSAMYMHKGIYCSFPQTVLGRQFISLTQKKKAHAVYSSPAINPAFTLAALIGLLIKLL